MLTPTSPLETLHTWLGSAQRSALFQAVPGAGKTTVLEKLSPEFPAGSVTVAFSKEIKREFEKRVKGRCLTVHGLGYALLRDLKGSTQFDPHKSMRLARAICGDSPAETERALTLVRAADLNQLNLGGLDLNWLLPDGETQDFVRAHIEAYQSAAFEDFKASGRVSFTEMVYLPALLCKGKRFPLIAVDEAQDLSKAALRLITTVGERLLFCGDAYQSIFGFAGADPDTLQSVSRHAGTQTESVVSRRCPQEIIALAKRLHPDIEAHPCTPGGLVRYLEEDEALESAAPGELVLSRNTAPLLRACLSLRAQGRAAYIRGVTLGEELLKLTRSLPQFWSCPRTALANETALVHEQSSDGTPDARNLDRLSILNHIVATGATSEATLRAGLAGQDLPTPGAVQLSSLHRAKGLESEHVTLIGLGRGERASPHPQEFIQERNLKYVGVTRVRGAVGAGRLTVAASREDALTWLNHTPT